MGEKLEYGGRKDAGTAGLPYKRLGNAPGYGQRGRFG